MRFILIDRITHWEPGRRGKAVKNITLSDDCFDDHFPLKPIMPGVLLLEGMAQLSGLLLEEGVLRDSGRAVKALMSMVERAKFRKAAYPGDSLELEAEVQQVNEAGGKTAALVRRGDEVLAECTLLFSFHAYSNPRLEARRAETLALLMRDLPGHAQR
jgi:3-hydroxyacyl-[acyl-carrier-protein] dehydratase